MVNKIIYSFTSAIEGKRKKQWAENNERKNEQPWCSFFFLSECHKSETKLKEVSVNYNKHGKEVIFWWSHIDR